MVSKYSRLVEIINGGGGGSGREEEEDEKKRKKKRRVHNNAERESCLSAELKGRELKCLQSESNNNIHDEGKNVSEKKKK